MTTGRRRQGPAEPEGVRIRIEGFAYIFYDGGDIGDVRAVARKETAYLIEDILRDVGIPVSDSGVYVMDPYKMRAMYTGAGFFNLVRPMEQDAVVDICTKIKAIWMPNLAPDTDGRFLSASIAETQLPSRMPRTGREGECTGYNTSFYLGDPGCVERGREG